MCIYVLNIIFDKTFFIISALEELDFKNRKYEKNIFIHY